MKPLFFSVCTAAVLFSGCISVNLPKQEIRETKTYDISRTATDSFPFRVEILPVRSDSPAKFKMLRRSGTLLTADEYNKWAQTPSRIMTQNFRSAFRSATKQDPAFKLSGNILSFELDEPSRSAVLSTAYTVSALDGKEPLFSCTLTSRIPVEELSADAFARAMEQAVSTQVADIKKRILDSVKPQ